MSHYRVLYRNKNVMRYNDETFSRSCIVNF